MARLRAELTAALALGGGGGRVDVASVVMGPGRSAGMLAAWLVVGCKTKAVACCGRCSSRCGLRSCNAPTTLLLQVTAGQARPALRPLLLGAACGSVTQPLGRRSVAAQ